MTVFTGDKIFMENWSNLFEEYQAFCKTIYEKLGRTTVDDCSSIRPFVNQISFFFSYIFNILDWKQIILKKKKQLQ